MAAIAVSGLNRFDASWERMEDSGYGGCAGFQPVVHATDVDIAKRYATSRQEKARINAGFSVAATTEQESQLTDISVFIVGFL